MVQIFLFILGAIVGSFLNVVGLRYRSGLTLQGRSFCPSCEKKLSPLELVPVLSFLLQRGKCKSCGAKISWQYPLVEIWTSIFFVLLYLKFGLTTYFLLLTTTFCLYTVILIYDFRHKIIPDLFVYTSIVLALVYRLTTYYLLPTTVLDWLAGPILFSFFGLIWLVSKGRAMGFGDAKLGLSLGLLLGASAGFSSIVLAFWIGALVTISLMLFSQKSFTMKTEIPFAPFMIFGALISLYFSIDLFYVQTLVN